VGQDGQVTGGDLLQEALAELYSSDPDEFTQRRAALVARARAAGDAPAAKRIAALRRPTRSAWVLNRLARSAPGVTSELDALGEELRAAHRSLDGAAIRELSSRRRELIDALARQAFAVSGLPSPSAALRVEVNSTLGAALANPQVAEQLGAGTLERAAGGDGFGSAGPPELTLVTSPDEHRTPPERAAAARAPARAPAGPTRPAAKVAAAAKPAAKPAAPAKSPAKPAAAAKPAAPARAAANVAALAAARERMEQERRRQVIAESQEAAAEADRAASAAASAEREQENVVRLMEQHLADARRDLADARRDLAAAKLQARAARTRQLQARQALDRLPE
jgi:hypothetical protein